MNDICAICQRDMSDNTYTLPECGHAFHLDCLMMWFRSPREYRQDFGSCPMCRTLPVNSIGWSTLKGRCRLLKRLAKKKNSTRLCDERTVEKSWERQKVILKSQVSFLCFKVHSVQAEAHIIAFSPFKIVHE